MSFVCLGLNHRTAPVEIRERMAFGSHDIPSAAEQMLRREGVEEVVILSTCNRVEIYGAASHGAGRTALDSLRAYLCDRFQVSGEAVQAAFYASEDAEAVRHLLRVVSGLDSMMLGETEIFGQVKKAYAEALAAGATSKRLNKLFQSAFQIGKLVRSSTQITHGATSVGAAAVDLAGKIFGDLSQCRVMVLGAGEMSRRTVMSLKSRGAGSVIVSNRSFDKAVELASEVDGRAIRFDDWERQIAGVDIMITSTAAPHHVIGPEHARRAMRKRRGSPLFIIDIAVPRDVDPAVGGVDGVYLYDIDALEAIAEDGRRERARQVALCDQIIDREMRALEIPPPDSSRGIGAHDEAARSHARGDDPESPEGGAQPIPNR